jgi:hypothetical protein
MPCISLKACNLRQLPLFVPTTFTLVERILLDSLRMKADWIEIKRGDMHPQQAGVRASMNPKGHIVINRVTHQTLGEPAAFLILYDRVNMRIGLKPASLSTRNAYPALKSNRSGAKLVYGYRLMREHRINLEHPIQFDDARIDEDGILLLDLRTAIVSRRGLARQKRIEHG